MTVWEITNYPQPGRRSFCATRDGADLARQRAPMSSQCEITRVWLPDNRVELCEFLNGLLAESPVEEGAA